jgi:hypothetical protein
MTQQLAYDKEKYIAEAKERVASALDSILEAIKSDQMPAMVEKMYIHMAGKPCDAWSFGNLCLMYLQALGRGVKLEDLDREDGRTYQTWQAVGRQVKSGAKAFYILEPNKFAITVKKKDATTGIEKDEQIQILRFKAGARFRIQDTEISNPDTWNKANQEFKPRVIPPLLNVAQELGVKVVYRNTNHGEHGSTDGEKVIYLSTEAIDTFFHELAHVGHAKLEPLKMGQDTEQEAIAQLAACTLCKIFGYDAIPYTAYYIRHYAEGHTKDAVQKLCMKVLSKVRVVLSVILAENPEAREKVIAEYQKSKNKPEGAA